MKRGVSRFLRIALASVLAMGLIPAVAFADDAAEPKGVAPEVAALEGEQVEDGSVLALAEALTPMSLGVEYDATFSYEEGVVFEFTAPETGYYEFFSFDCGDDDPVAYLYDSSSLTDSIGYADDWDEYNFNMLCFLSESETVYLQVSAYGEDGGSYKVAVQESATAYDLSTYELYCDPHYAIAGEPDSLTVCANRTGVSLVQGVDFEIAGYEDEYGNPLEGFPTEEGTYSVLIEGVDPYSGYAWINFDIYGASSLYLASVTFDGVEHPDDFKYTGGPASLGEEIVALDGTVLEEGVHYEAHWYDEDGYYLSEPPTEVGDYNVCYWAIEGSGYEGATGTYWVSIYDPYDFSTANVYLYEEVYLYTGEPIKPTVQAYSYNGTDLVEGVDYNVELKDNVGSPDETTEGVAIVHPMGDYHGNSFKLTFSIVPYYDIATLVDEGNFGVKWETTENSRDLLFLEEGTLITPEIVFEVSDGLIEGEDYTVSYADESGSPVVPKEAGDYFMIVAGAEDGSCRGEATIPFSIVSKVSLSEYAEIFPQANYGWAEDVEYVIYGEEGAEKLFWHGYSWGFWGSGNLVEGYDFTVMESKDNATGIHTATFVGQGRYEGTLEITYRYETEEYDFQDFDWFVNGEIVDLFDESYENLAKASVDEDGVIIPSVVTNYFFLNGVDFEVAGYLDSEGDEVSSAKSGDMVYINVVGLGEYEGCSALLPVGIVDADYGKDSLICFDESCELYLYAPYAWPDGTEEGSYFWLKSNDYAPWEEIYCNETDEILLKGVHYTKKESRANSALTLTFEAVPGSGYEGSLSVVVKLVDKYDIAKIAEFYADEEYVYPAGTSLTPYYEVFADGYDLEEGIDYAFSIKNPEGKTVDSLTETGEYKLVVTGKGDWTGSLERAVSAEARGESAIPLSYAYASHYGAFLHTGSAIEPEVEIEYRGYTLVEGQDYVIEYFNNTEIGNAYIVATAVEGSSYSGSLASSFAIVDAFNFDNSELYYYDDEACGYRYLSLRYPPTVSLPANGTAELDVIVKDYSYQLGYPTIDPKYYDVTYGGNTSAGVAWVKVTGKNGFEGELAANFVVEGREVTFEPDPDIWSSFPDVTREVNRAGGPYGVWYVSDGWLDYVVEAGLMSGYASNGLFGPYDNITRGQVAVILYRAECAKDRALVDQFGSTTDPAKYAKDCEFEDMRANDYYTAAVNWAKAVGIMTGDSGTNYTTVRPNDPVSRQELCVMLDRYVNGEASADEQLAPGVGADIIGMNKVASWARGSVNWAVNNGVIYGVDNHDGTYSMNPTDTTWRAAAAKMFTVVMRDII